MLAIGALAGKPYSSGTISTKDVFKYGKFSAAVKPSKFDGTWTSFYLMGQEFSDKVEIWDQWTAIHYVPMMDDPFLTKGSSLVNSHWEGEPNVEEHESFYYYDIEWTPTRMTFKIDGNTVRTIEGPEV